MDIGMKIRAARHAKGLSLQELGDILGVQKSAVAKYENGRIKNIKRSTLQKIATVLDIRPSELIFDEIEQSPVEAAKRHFEILMDEDFVGMFPDFQLLDAKQRKIVTDLAHTLAETKKSEV